MPPREGGWKQGRNIKKKRRPGQIRTNIKEKSDGYSRWLSRGERSNSNRGPLFQILEEVGAFFSLGLGRSPSLPLGRRLSSYVPAAFSKNKYLSLHSPEGACFRRNYREALEAPDEYTLVLVSPGLVHERKIRRLLWPVLLSQQGTALVSLVSLVCSCALCSCALCSTCRLALSSS